MAELVLDQLGVGHGAATRLHRCSATIPAGRLTAVVGRNGAGKSTLLRAIAALSPVIGEARLDGDVIAAMSPRVRAQRLGYLPQQHDFAWAMSVRAMVALGRYAFGEASTVHHHAVDTALAACGISALAERPVDRLSGGERALAALARLLCAETPLLLLDEPVAALDAGRQYEMLELLSELARTGRTVVVVLHDVALAAQFADQILWLGDGRVIADTPATQSAITMHSKELLGRAPRWVEAGDGPPVPYFER